MTGSAGLSGSHLREWLVAQGDKVVCLDGLSTGRLDNVVQLRDDPRFTVLDHDVIAPLQTEAPVVDRYSLTCPASPLHYRNAPVSTLKTCLVSVLNVLELTQAAQAKVPQTSTIEVYCDVELDSPPQRFRGNVDPPVLAAATTRASALPRRGTSTANASGA